MKKKCVRCGKSFKGPKKQCEPCLERGRRRMRELRKDPEYMARFKEYFSRYTEENKEELRRKQIEAYRKRMEDPVYRERERQRKLEIYRRRRQAVLAAREVGDGR